MAAKKKMNERVSLPFSPFKMLDVAKGYTYNETTGESYT